jgi:hypothetical protein
VKLDPIGLLFWAIILGGMFTRGPAMIYIFFAMQSFGTVALVPPALLGGTTFTPEWVAFVALAVKVLLSRPRLSQALLPLFDFRRFGLLGLVTLYAVFSAIFMPQLFRGVLVIPMRMANAAYPLAPQVANFTQTFYFVLTTLAVLVFYYLIKDLRFKKHVFNGILLGGGMAVLTGLADIVVPSSLLTPFRTASYAILAGGDFGEGKRVAGLMSEASAYGSVCIGFAGSIFFLRGAYEDRRLRTIVAPIICMFLVAMIGLSTSSGGYVGLAVLFCIFVAYILIKIVTGNSVGVREFYFLAAALILALVLAAVRPDIYSAPIAMVNQIVFQKHLTSSYVERSYWNQVSLEAARSTFWLGAGLGSARASSWAVAVLGNIGIVGAALMVSFLGKVFLSRPASSGWGDAGVARGAKFALIPLLTVESLSGTSVGFGLVAACLCGMVGAVCWDVKPSRSHGRSHQSRVRLQGSAWNARP